MKMSSSPGLLCEVSWRKEGPSGLFVNSIEFHNNIADICVFLQQFQVVATEKVNPVALEADIEGALATEKLDGTCCYVAVYNGEYLNEYSNHFLFVFSQCSEQSDLFFVERPYLWARLDRKPNKQAEKRFKKHQHSHGSCKGSAGCMYIHSCFMSAGWLQIFLDLCCPPQVSRGTWRKILRRCRRRGSPPTESNTTTATRSLMSRDTFQVLV